MIERNDLCYVFKANRNNQRLYKRTIPASDAPDAITKWNTVNKLEAGFLTKEQWQKRSQKWTYLTGWMLENQQGEVEVLAC